MKRENNNSVKDLVASDLPKSEVITTLSKRVLTTETNLENYEWFLSDSFAKKMVFDGVKDYNYTEYKTTTTGTPYGDSTIADFNADTNIALRETIEATTQSNVKTKILDSQMMNFRTNERDTIVVIFQNTENIRKTQGKEIEQAYWNLVSTTTTIIDTITIANDIDVNKLVYNTLLEMETTTKVSPFIGVNGVITIGPDTIQPSHRFKSKEFIYVVSPLFQTNTVFDGERSFFNWGGKQLEVNKIIVLDIPKYEGMADADKVLFTDFKAILIHKSALETIMDWEATKIVNTARLYQIVHNYMKYTPYKRLDKPIIMFRDVPVSGFENKHKQTIITPTVIPTTNKETLALEKQLKEQAKQLKEQEKLLNNQN